MHSRQPVHLAPIFLHRLDEVPEIFGPQMRIVLARSAFGTVTGCGIDLRLRHAHRLKIGVKRVAQGVG